VAYAIPLLAETTVDQIVLQSAEVRWVCVWATQTMPVSQDWWLPGCLAAAAAATAALPFSQRLAHVKPWRHGRQSIPYITAGRPAGQTQRPQRPHGRDAAAAGRRYHNHAVYGT